MTNKNVEKLVLYWQKTATLDLKSAEDIALKARRYPQSLFFVHLANEKILKAYAVFINKEHAPYSHNLVHLAKSADLKLSQEFHEWISEKLNN